MIKSVAKFTSVSGSLLSSLSTVLMTLLAFYSVIEYGYFVGIGGKCGTPQASVVFCLYFYGIILLASAYSGWRLCKTASRYECFTHRCFVWTRVVFIASAIFWGLIVVIGLS
jgi:hypothetical protein